MFTGDEQRKPRSSAPVKDEVIQSRGTIHDVEVFSNNRLYSN